jgi:SAM-dependent methyltransferase
MDPMSRLPAQAFSKADTSSDALFYASPRLVMHIDDGAVAAVTSVYRRWLPAGGIVLDLMSSWVSHLPPERDFRAVIGHGMNADELAANPRLTQRFVQDLNAETSLPLDDASVDAACLCVGVQYLQRPVSVFAELRRVLRPDAPVIVTFSNRCFPTKAVALWQALDERGHRALVSAYFEAAGLTVTEADGLTPAVGDPL